MEDRREAGYVITNGNPTGTERKTESKTENKTENKMGNVNESGIVMGTPADLEVSGIKFHYGKREILKGTGFQARRGEVCLLLGANGAGKTTLLKCINGLLKASDGTVKWLGKDTAPLSLREKARIFGYVPQNTQAGLSLTVMETVISGRLPFSRGKTGKEDVEKSAQVLEQFGLSDYAFRQMGQLSGGERQRILIARALAGDPQVLLLDEPTSSLDLRYQYEVMEFLVKVSREKNLAVVAVIHDLNLALDFADRVALLHDGHVLAEGATKEVITPDRIEKAYGIRAAIHNLEKRWVVLPEKSS